SGMLSDETDEDSYESCDRCDTSLSSVSYDAAYIYRLQQASKQLANTENHFYRNKVPLLDKVDKKCISLSMDLIAANETVFSYRVDDQIVLDNLVWKLYFTRFGNSSDKYMLGLSVESEMVEDANWHAEVRIRVTLGGNVLAPLPKFNHPVRLSSQSSSLIIFIVDCPTVKAWSSGLVQVDIYPNSMIGLNNGPLFSVSGNPTDVAISVKKAGARRSFYVNRKWIESQSDYIDNYFNSEFANGTQEMEINNVVSPKDFLLLLRAMERFDEHEMFQPDKFEKLLHMISLFQTGPLQRTVSSCLERSPFLDSPTKLILADRYGIPWPIVERLLNKCDPFIIRRTLSLDNMTVRLRDEILRRTNHFPSALPRNNKSFATTIPSFNMGFTSSTSSLSNSIDR
ncbi:hypothetical protein PMAYCL1PPCAC_24222, partial [Pristionchus mayeri]